MASTSNVNSNSKIERAHQMYRDGKYQEALGFYTEALSLAKTKPQIIALHSNRAACYLKLHNFKKAAEECTWVLELDHNHTGALMLRAQTLVTLKEYSSALFDVSRLIDLNPSSEVYQNLQARLKTQLSLAPIPEDDAELEEEDDEAHLQEDEEEKGTKAVEVREDGGKQMIDAVVVPNEQKGNVKGVGPKSEVTTQNRTISKSSEQVSIQNRSISKSSEQVSTQNRNISKSSEQVSIKNRSISKSSEQESSGWQAIPKPKGHSQLDYSRWDRVEGDSSEDDDEDDDDDSQPQYRFRVRKVGVHAVK